VLGTHRAEWKSLLAHLEPQNGFNLNLSFVRDDQKTSPPPEWKNHCHLDLSEVFQYNGQCNLGPANIPNTETTSLAVSTTQPSNLKTVLVNDKDQRVDPQLASYTFDEWQLYHNIKRTKEPCRYHHLSKCTSKDCQYDHGRLSEAMMLVLLHITRATPCDDGSSCRDAECPYGHHCSRAGCDMRKCRFSTAAHGAAFDPSTAMSRPAFTIAPVMSTTSTTSTTLPIAAPTTTLAPRPAATARTPKIAVVSPSPGSNDTPNVSRVLINSKKQRIDPIIPRPSKLDLVRFMRLQNGPSPPCQSFFLSQCVSAGCGLDHTPLDASMTNIFAIGARQIPCQTGSECRDEGCTLGHHCQMRYCDNKDCKFPAALHNNDMIAALPPAPASPSPALTAASVLGPSRPRKVVKTTWSSKPKDTIEYVSAGASTTRLPGSRHSSPVKKQPKSSTRQNTPSHTGSSPACSVSNGRIDSTKSIDSWKAFAAASHVEHTRPNNTPAASTPTGPATVAPAGFDLIDFDFEDRVGIGEVQEQTMDPAAVFRRAVLARSETSSPAQTQAQAQNEQILFLSLATMPKSPPLMRSMLRKSLPSPLTTSRLRLPRIPYSGTLPN